MRRGARAKFPDAGVRLVVELDRALAEPFHPVEVLDAGAPKQPMIEKRLRRREHRMAVHVVLMMLVGLVADTDRAETAIAGERGQMSLGDRGFEPDPVHRLQIPRRLRLMHDVGKVAQIILYRRHFGESVQRPHDEERVAQPAVAVIPGALGIRRLGNARRDGRHDRAGFLVRAKLQRDRRANDGILPFQRKRERARPAAPVVFGALLEFAREIADVAIDRLVDAEQQVNRPVEQMRRLAERVDDRHVGRQAHGLPCVHVTDVMAAARDFGSPRAIVEARVEAQAKRRMPLYRPDAPDHQQWLERAPAVAEARREVGNLRDVARAVDQRRLEDRRVGHVTLARFDEIVDFDREAAGHAVRRRFAEQCVQHRITVRARHAAPDHRPGTIDQRVERAVADEPEFEARLRLAWRRIHALIALRCAASA